MIEKGPYDDHPLTYARWLYLQFIYGLFTYDLNSDSAHKSFLQLLLSQFHDALYSDFQNFNERQTDFVWPIIGIFYRQIALTADG